MTPKYSKTEFEGYTHRFVIRFVTDAPHDSTIDLYSDSDSYESLKAFIEEKKTDKVRSFQIAHRSSKEQDEASAKFIDEWIKTM